MLQIHGWTFALAFALPLTFATVSPAQPVVAPFENDDLKSRLQEMKRAQEKAKLPRPNLKLVTSPELELALKDPDSFWKFVTSPETPYIERMAAVWRLYGSRSENHPQTIFPVERLPQLMAAIGEVRRARKRFSYGRAWRLKRHPLDNALFFASAPKPPQAGEELVLLGHKWTVPAQEADYPLTFEEESRAPYPWQLERLLDELFRATAPEVRAWPPEALPPFEPGMAIVEPAPAEIEGYLRGIERAREYHRAALRMPLSTDEEAGLFIEATRRVPHRPLEVMARWRRIALDARFPESAVWVASEAGGGTGAWGDAPSRAAAQALTIDILRRSPQQKTRIGAASSLPRLRSERWRGSQKLRGPVPFASVLAASEQAFQPESGDEWTRLYSYVGGICRVVENPPFDPQTINAMPEPQEISRRLEVFRQWFTKNEAQIQANARAEMPDIEAARAAMEKFEPTR